MTNDLNELIDEIRELVKSRQRSESPTAKSLIIAHDEDQNEALYVDGVLCPIDGDTVYACDIAEAAGDELVTIRRVEFEFTAAWPERLSELRETP